MLPHRWHGKALGLVVVAPVPEVPREDTGVPGTGTQGQPQARRSLLAPLSSMTTDRPCPISHLFPGPKGATSRAAPCRACCGCGTRGAAPPSPCRGQRGAGKSLAEGQGSVSILPVAVRSCNSRGGWRRWAQVSHSHGPTLPWSVCRCLLATIPCSPCVGDSSPMSLWDMELPGIGRRTGLDVFGSFGPQQWHITGELHAPGHAQLSSLTRHIHIPGAKSLCGAAMAGASTGPHPPGHQRDEPCHK